MTESASGSPISDVTVSYSTDGNRTRTSVQSDAAGHFTLTGVPAGRLYLTAVKDGYVNGGYGQRRVFASSQWFDLSAGERVTGVNFLLSQYASVTGQVTDQDGRPIAGVEVAAHRLTVVTGRLALDIGPKARTGPDGRYRLDRIYPVSYVVSATFATGQPQALGRGGGGGAQQPTLDYPRLFYPDGFVAADATVLEFSSGEIKTNVDVRQRALAATQIKGRVTGAPTAGMMVELIRESNPSGIQDNLAATTVPVATDGAFLFPRVFPGRYRATVLQFPKSKYDQNMKVLIQSTGPNGLSMSYSQAQADLPLAPVPNEPTLWAEAAINVGAEPVTDVTLALQPAGRIIGRIVHSGTAPAPSAETLAQAIMVVQRPSGRITPSFPVARVEPDGSFKTVGLPPGMYSLMFQPIAPARGVAWPPMVWKQAGIESDGHTLSASLIELGSSDVTVTMTMTEKLAHLSGVVRDVTGRTRPDASVFIVQADRALWAAGAMARDVRPNRFGAYEAEVPPGDYLVVASADPPELWSEISVLERLMRTASRIRIASGEARIQDLQVNR